MRDILFRGKQIDNGEWVEGDYVRPNNILLNGFDVYKVIPKTVGQFTGLLDKDRKKIFEGDILTSKFGDGEPYSINFGPYKIWDEYGVSNAIGFYTYPEKSSFGITIKGDTEAYTVIGNIHDNPELLT